MSNQIMSVTADIFLFKLLKKEISHIDLYSEIKFT